ncbi:hypothetical protein H6F74_19965 [Trichocoleus sp. FACHB-90]|uniref:hypothetical protein n=1 Tax=Cyanophyceae TaxID=3028117 RepID=UPI00168367DD|nr:hypothetical protein [Trichocoleus sp. FACHB-90]MBD1928506.1 hypothetical protein [Trichocoleus sp. FACHB-90]
MLDLNTLSEFSRTHCIAICAFLVPANLVATTLTVVAAARRRPPVQVWRSAIAAIFFALVMVFHVWTWFQIGVVMAPTYILLWLGSTCLVASLAAIAYNHHTTRSSRNYATAPTAANNP